MFQWVNVVNLFSMGNEQVCSDRCNMTGLCEANMVDICREVITV